MAVRIADTLKQQNNLTTFPVAYGEDIWLDKNKGTDPANYKSLQAMYNDDELGGGSIQVTTMPTASETYLDTVLLYIGETGTYKYGTYYKCVSDGETPPTYSWVDAGIGGGSSIFYGTMDEWNALTADEKKKYDYMADGDAGGSYIDAYSTTETKTNKVWIDGKPIYRKVVSLSATKRVNNESYTNLGITFPNDADTMFLPIVVSFFGELLYYNSYKPIQAACRAEVDLVSGTNFILEYTKTTD
jgi:hypothetical protein